MECAYYYYDITRRYNNIIIMYSTDTKTNLNKIPYV